MTVCTIRPMSEANRKCSKKFRHQPPPIFMDIDAGGVTKEDIEEAKELFKILDPESRDWYGRTGIFERL
jgi:hypothetical protein